MERHLHIIIKAAIACLTLLRIEVAASQESMVSCHFLKETGATAYKEVEKLTPLEGCIAGWKDEAGTDGRLEIKTAGNATSCGASLKVKIPATASLVISFDYITSGDSPAHSVTASITDSKGGVFAASLPPSRRMKTAVLQPAEFKNAGGMTVDAGMEIRELSILYDAPGCSSLGLQDILAGKAPDSPGGERISYSARPMFNWARMKGEGFLLEYSQDPCFIPGSTAKAETVNNFHVPANRLDSGLWYWRVFRKGKDEVVARGKLKIPRRAHDFIVPKFDLAGLADKTHPRLKPTAIFNSAENAKLRRNAQTALPAGIPAEPEIFKGRPYHSKDWVDWFRKTYDLMVNEVGRGMSSTGQAAEAFDDNDLKEKAKALLLEISASWDPLRGASNMKKCGDLEAGAVLQGMCWCFDAAYDRMNDVEQKQAVNAIAERARQFYDGLNPFMLSEAQNHPWSMAMTLGMAAIVCAGHRPEAAQWFEFSLDLYAYRFLPSMGFEGENNEGLQYWAFGGDFIMKYADMLKLSCGIDLYKHPWLRQTARFPVYCAPPHGYLTSFADYAQNGRPNHDNKGPLFKAFTRRLAEKTGDPYALWYSGAPKAGELKAKAPVDIPQSKLYSHIGLAVFNTCLADGRENVALGFHSGRYFAAHQHADQNSFVINAYGDKLAVDGGYYDWYGSPHFNDYATQTKAHNTILVDGEGQKVRRWGADGSITAYHDSPEFGYVEGDASNPAIYGGAVSSFKRKLVFIKPDTVISYDTLSARRGKSSAFSWLMHSQSDAPMKIDAESCEFAIERPLACLYGKALSTEGLTMKVVKSYDVPPSTPLSSSPLRPEDTANEWTLSISNAKPAKSLDLVVGLRIARSPEAKSGGATFSKLEDETACAVKDATSRIRSIVVFNKAPGHRTSPLAGVETDGDIAAVKFNDTGTVSGAMIINGTELTVNGSVIHRSDVRGDWSMPARPQPEEGMRNPPEILLGGQTIPCEISKLRQPDGGTLTVISGLLAIEKDSGFSISAGSDAINYRISNAKADIAGTVSRDSAPTSAFLERGEYLLTFTGGNGVKRVALTPLNCEFLNCVKMPPAYIPPDSAIKMEAETPSEGSAGKAKDAAGASNAKAASGWSQNAGETAMWTFDLKESHDFNLLIRASGSYDHVMRLVAIDGTPPFAIKWDATTGWYNDRMEWSFLRVPRKLHLSAGKHNVKISFISADADLDMLALVPAE